MYAPSVAAPKPNYLHNRIRHRSGDEESHPRKKRKPSDAEIAEAEAHQLDVEA
jgi:hypothetical protein